MSQIPLVNTQKGNKKALFFPENQYFRPETTLRKVAFQRVSCRPW